MKCPSCNRVNIPPGKHCPNCGAALPERKKSKLSSLLNTDLRGAKPTATSETPPDTVRDDRMDTEFQEPKQIKGERSVGVAYLLWCTIFGHRWYLGQTAPVYFLTFGYFFIMWFIDFFRIPRMVRKYNSYVYARAQAQATVK